MKVEDRIEIKLKEVEKDFIEFIARKREIDKARIEKQYIDTIKQFQCHSIEFKKLNNQIHKLNKIFYDFEDPKYQISTYKFHALIYILRYLSYSYIYDLKTVPISEPINIRLGKIYKNTKRIIKSLYKKPKTTESFDLILNKETLEDNDLNLQCWMKGLVYQHKKIAKYLVSLIKEDPIIIDYGSGLGYFSFEIGKLYPNSKIYLVDIDSLVLEFAEYQFKKHGINVETIPITSHKKLYPELPKHNICIATEVMEHVIEPLKVLNNIKSSINQNGIIFGNFNDHADEEQHVSCNLFDLRDELKKSFEQINDLTWRKISLHP